MSFEDARRAVVAACEPLESEAVALGQALHRTVRTALVAREDLIPYARSAMDGFALRAVDAVPGTSLPIGGHAYSGSRERLRHAPRSATAVATGAPLPDGADAVVPFERIDRRGERIEIRYPADPGDHIFPAGDDARAGDVLAACGERLTAGTLALLAAAGHGEIACTRMPRVGILTTGEELVSIAQTPGFGQIRNSNATLARASFPADEAVVVFDEHVGDDRTLLRAALERATEVCDLIFMTGGASVGERDYTKAVLGDLGAAYAFRSVALRPARPAAFATLGRTRILALPGNPAAAFVGLHVFGVPAIRALCGARAPLARPVRAHLRGSLHGKAERTYLAFVRLTIDGDGRLEARPLDNQCSSLTRTAAGAAGFAILGPTAGDARSGDLIDVEVFAWDAIV